MDRLSNVDDDSATYDQYLFRKLKDYQAPQHIAFLMDGNRRFARARGMPLAQAYMLGKEKTRDVIRWCRDLNIQSVTFHALSTDNLAKRSAEELDVLFELYESSFLELAADPEIHKNKVRCRIIAETSLLPASVATAIEVAENSTRAYTGQNLTITLAYGSRRELVSAVTAIAMDSRSGRINPTDINESLITSRLHTTDLPDPDLVIRTSGEQRLSNFMLWQLAYSELFFVKAKWPELRKRDLLRAVIAYQKRQRRYGA